MRAPVGERNRDHPSEGEQYTMDWATDSAWTVPARWAAIVLGLGACAVDLGCTRMHSFLRDEPPMLGASTSPGSHARADVRRGPKISSRPKGPHVPSSS